MVGREEYIRAVDWEVEAKQVALRIVHNAR
jgi:hypothetical protein